MATTAELLVKLKQMAAKAGKALFERAGMALEVLVDAQYIAASFGGDKAAAEEKIAADCFPDLSMGGWFGKVLILRQTFDLATWEQHKFNLQRLWIEYQKKQEKEKPKAERQGPIPRKEYEETVEKLESAQYQLRKAREENVNWKERCRDLERDLAEARGRIAALELLLDRYAPADAVA